MKITKEKMLLSSYCRSNNSSGVSSLLKEHINIDLSYNDGIYFQLSVKNQNADMLKSLLDYYEKTKLLGDRDSMAYKTAKHTLRQILDDATEQYPITPAMQEIMAPYVTTADDNTENSDSEPEEIACDRSWLDSVDNHDTQKEENSSNIVSLTASNLDSLGYKTPVFQDQLKLSGDHDDSDF